MHTPTVSTHTRTQTHTHTHTHTHHTHTTHTHTHHTHVACAHAEEKTGNSHSCTYNELIVFGLFYTSIRSRIRSLLPQYKKIGNSHA